MKETTSLKQKYQESTEILRIPRNSLQIDGHRHHQKKKVILEGLSILIKGLALFSSASSWDGETKLIDPSQHHGKN